MSELWPAIPATSARAAGDRSIGEHPDAVDINELDRASVRHFAGPTEGGNSTQRCPGISGYQLLVLYSDSRMSVTVVDPRGQQWALAYDKTISPPFTSLAPVALWRVVERGSSGDSLALVIKVIANEDPASERVTAYWAVAKVAVLGSCVTERVEAGSDEAARIEAATSAVNARPCLLNQSSDK